MAWKGVVCSLLFLLTLAESASRSGKVWSVNHVGGSIFNLPIITAGISALIALVLSLYLIFEHIIAYNQPEEQKFLIGLILMVPVYALESYMSLLDTSAAFNCQIVRDCYEAFALYCFERYLIACLGGEENTIKFMETQDQISSSTPLLEMILKMICALLAIFFEFFGVYGEGKFEWRYAYPYLAVVLNFSQTWALYCLVQFYTVIKDKLEPIKPLAKFLCFKSIVFLTWWQGVAIAFLFSMGAFKGSLAQELKTRIQDYIICIEMGVAAVVHLHIFPAKPYIRGERCVRNVAIMNDYASLGTPPDPDEVQDSARFTRSLLGHPDEREKRLNFRQSVCDVVLGSGEIVVDDVKFTVSHVVEPVERGIAKINRTLHQISENVKQRELRRKNSQDDNFLIPLNSWSTEFTEAHDHLLEGSVSDSGFPSGRRSNPTTISQSRVG